MARRPTSPKASAVLVYLAWRGGWVGRDELVELLRPDVPRAQGRRYLRGLIHRSRALDWAEGLEVEAARLRWLVPTDVAELRRAVREQRWREAVALAGAVGGGDDARFREPLPPTASRLLAGEPLF